MLDFINFTNDPEITNKETLPLKEWKILIVDDEIDVHTITELVMDDLEFQGRNICFLNAYTAQEARQILIEHKDIAVILLDVVMETPKAGLNLVKFIRNEINNKLVRIILRTGQPGNAPEKSVIIDYDINDYKDKTELTKAKLDTTIITAIRAYRDLISLDKSRKGLEKIVQSSHQLFELKSLKDFLDGILLQLTGLLKLEDDTMYLETSAIALDGARDKLNIVAGTGIYKSLHENTPGKTISQEILSLIEKSFQNKESYFEGNYYVGYFKTADLKEHILLLESQNELEEIDKYLIELFSKNINLAFYYNYKNQEIINTRDEIIYIMSEVSERHKTKETRHVRRVGEIAFRIASLMGLNLQESEEIRIAAVMHDVGKILIKNEILEKPGALNSTEEEIMREHTEIGEDILKNKSYGILIKSSEVAVQHHERWDGKGYPHGLKEESISLPARIASLALIYDALQHEQPYRKAWPEEEIIQYIAENSGKIFDPNLVELFMDNYEHIKEVNLIYPNL